MITDTSAVDNVKGTVNKAIDYIISNYTKDVTLDDVASAVNLNPSYFSVYFKQSTGEKFIDYLINLRMERAKELLLNTDYKVSAICDMVGYNQRPYFHRIFKHNTGLTPSEFRNKYRKVGNP